MRGIYGKNAYDVKKHIYNCVITDSKVEKDMFEALEVHEEVSVYAKLPRGFFIPTPVGDYNPDWAIVFKEGTVKHIYFIAETKGSMETLNLKGVEIAKIACAEKHFVKISNSTVKYHAVTTYDKLLEEVNR